MHADDALCSLGRAAEERDGYRRRITCQDRPLRRRGVEGAKEFELRFQMLCCRFDRHVDVERFELGMRMDACERCVAPGRIELTLLNTPVQVFRDNANAALD